MNNIIKINYIYIIIKIHFRNNRCLVASRNEIDRIHCRKKNGRQKILPPGKGRWLIRYAAG